MKKHLTRDEEFKIMLLVLDKFLWLGVGIMAYGFFQMISATKNVWEGLTILLAGALLLIIFMVMILKEYNYMK